MKEQQLFESKMAAYRTVVGVQATAETYLLFSEIVDWLISEGWGKVTLSAKDCRFSSKFRIDMVKEAKIPPQVS